MPGRTARLVAAGLLSGALLAGCGVKKTQRLPPQQVLTLREATHEELLSRLREQAAAVETLNAEAELVPSTGSAYSGVIEQYHDVKAFVLATRRTAVGSANSRHIRVIGQAPVVRKTVFDMVADEREFRISIPSKNKFVVGPTALERRSDKPIENLRPQHLLEALFLSAPEPGPLAMLFLEENEFSGRRYYALTEITAREEPADEANRGWRLARRWWFDRTDLSLVRVQRFDTEGQLLADIHYADWRDAGGVSYPRSIELVRPQEDYRLKLLIKGVRLNEPIAPEKFALEKPAGAELVELQSAPKEKESR